MVNVTHLSKLEYVLFLFRHIFQNKKIYEAPLIKLQECPISFYIYHTNLLPSMNQTVYEIILRKFKEIGTKPN